MISDKNRLHLERHFLNPLGISGNAYICSSIRKSRRIEEYYGAIEITDCNNKINLHYDITNKEEKGYALHKLDQLINTLKEHRRVLSEIEIKQKKPRAKRTKSKEKIKAEIVKKSIQLTEILKEKQA